MKTYEHFKDSQVGLPIRLSPNCNREARCIFKVLLRSFHLFFKQLCNKKARHTFKDLVSLPTFFQRNVSFSFILSRQLHRRLLYDDGKGVDEPLDEHAFGNGLVARGKHIIQLNDDEEKAVTAHRFKTLETVYSPVATFANTAYNLTQWLDNFNKSVRSRIHN